MNNNAARRGFGKAATNKDLMASLGKAGQDIIDLAKGNETFISDAQKKGNPGQVIVLDEVGGAMQTREEVKQFMEQFSESPLQTIQEYGNKFMGSWGDIFMGGSNDVHNDRLPNTEYGNEQANWDSFLPYDPSSQDRSV